MVQGSGFSPNLRHPSVFPPLLGGETLGCRLSPHPGIDDFATIEHLRRQVVYTGFFASDKRVETPKAKPRKNDMLLALPRVPYSPINEYQRLEAAWNADKGQAFRRELMHLVLSDRGVLLYFG